MADRSVWDKSLESVERDENGSPIYLSPYGWKIEDIDGKKYVVAMNKQEAQALLARANVQTFDLDGCYGGGHGECKQKSTCSSHCDKRYEAGGWVCFCV